MSGSGVIRVVVCDDNPEVVDAVAGLLRTASDIDVVKTIGSAEELLATVADMGDGIDVVVLDNYLPGMTGIEALGRLRADGVMTPVVVLTADPRLRAKAHEHGATTFFSKAMTDPDGLLAAVREAAGSES